jgi:ribosome-binding protein aMBF1 (putative translation factor)
MRKIHKSRRFFSDRLKEDLKDPVVRKSFEEEGVTALVAIAVAKLREKAGLSQKMLADKIGVTQQVISRLEHPGKSNMTLSTLSKVASALGKQLTVRFQ